MFDHPKEMYALIEEKLGKGSAIAALAGVVLAAICAALAWLA